MGRLTGDPKTQIQGKLDQAAGAAQELYGQTADAARDTADGGAMPNAGPAVKGAQPMKRTGRETPAEISLCFHQ
jgi:CsbD-like protein